MHSATRLKLNDEMCHIAQAWAERIARTNTFEHSQNMYAGQSLGENIAMRFTSTGKIELKSLIKPYRLRFKITLIFRILKSIYDKVTSHTVSFTYSQEKN